MKQINLYGLYDSCGDLKIETIQETKENSIDIYFKDKQNVWERYKEQGWTCKQVDTSHLQMGKVIYSTKIDLIRIDYTYYKNTQDLFNKTNYFVIRGELENGKICGELKSLNNENEFENGCWIISEYRPLKQNIICTRCGSIKIKCQAWINPNEPQTEKALKYYSPDSLKSGYCCTCKTNSKLTDSEVIRKDIEEKYLAYKQQFDKEPYCASCEITYCSKRNGTDDVLIKISADKNGNKNYFPFCEDIDALKKICLKTQKSFIITKIHHFE